MPPQTLDLASESAYPLTGAYRDASFAALREAVPETHAAESAWSVSGLLAGYRHALRKWRQRARLRASLHELSDRDLKDIGLTPSDIAYIFPNRTIERLRDSVTYLWLSRGAM